MIENINQNTKIKADIVVTKPGFEYKRVHRSRKITNVGGEIPQMKMEKHVYSDRHIYLS